MNQGRIAARIPILCLHRVATRGPAAPVPPGSFDSMLGYSREMGFVSVHLEQIGLALTQGDEGLPGRPICICFDDCFADVLDHALPILERHGFKASFFAVAGLLGGHSNWENGPADRLPLMGEQDLRDLARAGHEVGSHCYWHCSLPAQNDRSLLSELVDSRRKLEDVVGQPVRVLAYPFGDVSARVEKAAEKAGYLAARGLGRSNLHHPASRFNLGVIKSGGDWTGISRMEIRYRVNPFFNFRHSMEAMAAQLRQIFKMADL